MIVKIRFVLNPRAETEFEGERWNMLFGDSYKSWLQQFIEYAQTYRSDKIADIKTSDDDWISFGGLKWCSYDKFQIELDKEGKGRKAEDIEFDVADVRIIKKIKAAYLIAFDLPMEYKPEIPNPNLTKGGGQQ